MKQRKLVIELVIYSVILILGIIMLFTKKFEIEFVLPDSYKPNAQHEVIDTTNREEDEDDTLFIE